MADDPIRRTRAYLTMRLEGTRVATEAPSNISGIESYIVINPNGGVETDFLDLPSILLDCHAKSDIKAYDLARRVASLMREMPNQDTHVSHVSTMAPYRNSWTSATTPYTSCYSVPCDMTINK